MREYTEEDTFRALLRPPILRMREMVMNRFGTSYAGILSMPDLRDFLKTHNWKLSEYIQESKKVNYD